MREESIVRLSAHTTNISDPNYLHYKSLHQDIKDAIEKYGKGSVLDMGCGNKPYESLFRNITKYTGCDVVQSSQNNVDILCPCTDLPLDNNQFDTVITTEVLEHVEDSNKMLSEAYRVLKPGGKIILTVPMCWNHHEVPYDFYRFTKYGLKYLFEKTGFNILYIKPNGGKWAMLGQMTQNIVNDSLKGKKSILRRILWLFQRYFFKYVINITYSFLEKIDRNDEYITLNFIVVAEKPIN